MSKRKLKYWKEEEVCDLVRMYNLGVPVEMIAEKFGVSFNAILQQLLIRGAGGKRRASLKPHRFWTPEEVRSMVFYHEQGFSLEKIARLLDRTRIAVQLKLHEWKKNVIQSI